MKQNTTSLRFSLLSPQETQQRYLLSIISKSLLAILFFLGIGGSLLEAFAPSVMLMVLLSIGIIGCVAFTFILDKKSLRLWSLIIVVIWLVVFYIILQEDILNGLRLTANHISEVMGRHFGRIYPIYDISVDQSGYELSATLFFIPVCLLLSLLCSYLVQARDVVVSLVITVALVFANIFLSIPFAAAWLGLLILAQFILLTQAYGRRKNFYDSAAPSYRFVTLIAAGLFVVFAVSIFLSLPSYSSSPLINARENLMRQADKLRYGVDYTRGMPDGDFVEIKAFEPSEETALEVTMERPTSLWMRGYVGSQYNGKGWDVDDPSSLYENADVFYWLHQDNFYGQKQLADSAIVTGEESSDRAFGIHVKNVGASSRNIYAPYEVYSASEQLMPSSNIGDTALESTGFYGTRDYAYHSLPNLVRRYPDMVRELYGENKENMLFVEPFLLVESNYAEYVYEQYTQVPEEVELWVQEYLKDVLPKKEEANYSDAKQAIIKYLTEETTYSTDPSLSESGDFAYDFLFLDKTGYSVHYATAATLMFRASGIPARYVEGYLITPEDVEDVPENSVLKLDGTHAHAWVEVYQSGVGWIPVEVTPPYFGLMEEADSLEGVPGARDDSKEDLSKEDENIEEQSEVPDKQGSQKAGVGSYPIAIIIAVIVAVLLFIVLRRLLKYNRWFKEKLESCLDKNNRAAIMAMFTCAMDAAAVLGLKNDGVWLIDQLTLNLHQSAGISEERMKEIFSIYQEAAYSSHELSDEKRKKIKDFLGELYQLLTEHFTGLKRFKVRHLLKLLSAINSAQ